MVIKEREIDTCKKERTVWLLISMAGVMVFYGLMISGVVYNVRPMYGLYIIVLSYGTTCISFIMYSLTRYISTMEIVTILLRKIREGDD